MLIQKIELFSKVSYLVLVLASFNVFFARQAYITYCAYAVAGICIVTILLKIAHLKDYTNGGTYLLFFFILSYVLGSVVTYRYGVIDNIKTVIWLSIQYFVLFAFDKNRDYCYEKDIILKTVLIYTMFCSLVSLIMMLKDWKYEKVIEDIYLIRGGFIHNRLFGCYVDPNYGAVLSVVAIIIAVYYLFILFGEKESNHIKRLLLFVSLILNFLYICYSSSRTGFLAMILAAFVFCVLLGVKEKKIVKRIFVGAAILVAFVVLIYLVQVGTSKVRMDKARADANWVGATYEEVISRVRDANVSSRFDIQISDKMTSSDSRIAIWKNAIDLFKQHPITGISFRNINEYALDNIPDTYAGFESMHNAFFDILVSQGVIGIIIAMTFFVWALYMLINKYKKLSEYREFLFFVAIVVAIFTSTFTYSEVFFMNTGGAFLFWYLLGYLINYKEKTELIEEEK